MRVHSSIAIRGRALLLLLLLLLLHGHPLVVLPIEARAHPIIALVIVNFVYLFIDGGLLDRS